MLNILQRQCLKVSQRYIIAYPDQKSMIDFLMTVFDGERITAKIKQFMLMIQMLTPDYMLKRFLKAKGSRVFYKVKAVSQDKPPVPDKIKNMPATTQKNVKEDFQKTQDERGEELKCVPSEDNVQLFYDANELH